MASYGKRLVLAAQNRTSNKWSKNKPQVNTQSTMNQNVINEQSSSSTSQSYIPKEGLRSGQKRTRNSDLITNYQKTTIEKWVGNSNTKDISVYDFSISDTESGSLT